MDWKKLLLMTGGAAGAAALIYCVLREEAEAKELPVKSEERENRAATITKEEVLEILEDWLASIDKMKVHMKDITKKLRANSLSLDQSYRLVTAVEPQDTIEKYNLSREDFDKILNRYKDDPQVKHIVTKIMSPDMKPSAEESKITVNMLIEVHAFMLQELENLLKDIDSSTKKEAYTGKSMTLTAQAIVSAKVESKFRVTAEETERAMIRHHAALATNQEFGSISVKMQACMARISQL